MTAFLKTNFISKLAAFANAPAFATLPEIGAQVVRSTGDPMSHRYTETIVGENLTIELVWEGFEPPRALELSPHEVASGEQNMFSLLVPAHSAQIIVNGRPPCPASWGRGCRPGMRPPARFLFLGNLDHPAGGVMSLHHADQLAL